jgi:NTE family protein
MSENENTASSAALASAPTPAASNGTVIRLDELGKVFYTDEVETHALADIHLAITTSSYSTGRSVVWVQGAEVEPWDGGIRQPAPLSPAVHLGAERIMAISTRFGLGPSFDPWTDRTADGPPSSGERAVVGYPPPAQVAGVLMNAIFLDLLDQDVHRLERLNGLLEELPPERRKGLRPIRLLSLRPSEDLGRMASHYEPQLPRGFRFLTRGLGTRETASPDALSLVLFQPDYICRLMDQGEADAEAQSDQIEAFLDGTS